MPAKLLYDMLKSLSMLFCSNPENPSNTYESITHSLPFTEGSPSATQELEYAYADRETVTARVISGFEVKTDMEKNEAYNSSTKVARDSSTLVASMADNPLYGGN